jgi:hypothetical protein
MSSLLGRSDSGRVVLGCRGMWNECAGWSPVAEPGKKGPKAGGGPSRVSRPQLRYTRRTGWTSPRRIVTIGENGRVRAQEGRESEYERKEGADALPEATPKVVENLPIRPDEPHRSRGRTRHCHRPARDERLVTLTGAGGGKDPRLDDFAGRRHDERFVDLRCPRPQLFAHLRSTPVELGDISLASSRLSI